MQSSLNIFCRSCFTYYLVLSQSTRNPGSQQKSMFPSVFLAHDQITRNCCMIPLLSLKRTRVFRRTGAYNTVPLCTPVPCTYQRLQDLSPLCLNCKMPHNSLLFARTLCWKQSPQDRPDMTFVASQLEKIVSDVAAPRGYGIILAEFSNMFFYSQTPCSGTRWLNNSRFLQLSLI